MSSSTSGIDTTKPKKSISAIKLEQVSVYPS